MIIYRTYFIYGNVINKEHLFGRVRTSATCKLISILVKMWKEVRKQAISFDADAGVFFSFFQFS